MLLKLTLAPKISIPYSIAMLILNVIITKVVLIWELALRQIFKLFPANIWILKLFFLMVFAIKMTLDNIPWVTQSPWILIKIILIASWSQNLDFKIQILAGNSLKICLGAFFEISTTLSEKWFQVLWFFYPFKKWVAQPLTRSLLKQRVGGQ